MRCLDSEQKKQVRKQLEKLLEEIGTGVIFVEGQRDLVALENLGCKDVLTISGNLRYSCEIVKNRGVKSVVVLTDLDKRGDELAEEARKELERYSIKTNLKIRRKLARLLDLKQFENAYRKYEEVWNEVTK